MSRCFPFPPPGYERKHRPEDLSVLKEAKQKDRKDRERRKHREKKDNDGSGEKHGDKKDRKEKRKEKKEKHRDKKKDENRGKEKEKSSISEEAIVARNLLEQSSVEKLHLEGLGCDAIGSMDNGIIRVQAIPETKFVQELNRRIRDDGKLSESQFPVRVTKVEKDGREARPETVALMNTSMEGVGEKGGGRNKGDEFRNMVDLQIVRNEPTRRPVIQQHHARVAESKIKGPSGLADGEFHTSFVDKERFNRGDNDLTTHGKDKPTRKEEKLRIKTEENEHERSKNVVMMTNPSGATTHKNGRLSFMDVDSATLNEENNRKRKGIDSNGFLHDGEIRPNKMRLQAVHPSIENGRKPEKFAFPNNDQVDRHKDRLMNGTVKAHNLVPTNSDAAVPTPVVATPQIAAAPPKVPHHDSGNVNEELNVPTLEDILNDASRRHPHPDSKYLNRVLKVPTVGHWSENDDQEWLFSKKDPPRKLPESGSEIRVWSKAVHIESADVHALPYVIPY